jgi:predicted metal-dependent hydrolase
LFGEEVPMSEIYKQYPIKKTEKNRTKILKEILADYATPLVDIYSEKIGIKYTKLSFRKTSSKR